MLVFASAVILFAFDSALAAPVSSHLVDYPSANSTHHHLARDVCPSGGRVSISYKKRIQIVSTKAILKLGDPVLENNLCVYPIFAGWPGTTDAVAVTTSERAGTADLKNYKDLMAITGDLLQDRITGNNRPWIVVDRSGSDVKDTSEWQNFRPSSYDPSRATLKQQKMCSNMMTFLHYKVSEHLELYQQNGFGYTHLTFGQIAFSQDWSKMRIVEVPVNFAEATDVNTLVRNLDIRASNGYITSASGQQTRVIGVC